jgi:predicted adenylyl cyclase CyaB
MIEVEKKFILNDDDIDRLTTGAEFLKEKTFTDIYYDTTTYALTTKDVWLRSRDGRFELKIPLHHKDLDRLADQYEELEEKGKIRAVLGLPKKGTFSENLSEGGYSPFCELTTTRRKFKKDEFNIDLDTVHSADFSYNIGEVELMVDDVTEMSGAIDKIMAFAKEKNLTIAPVRGKVLEYLKLKNPKHYQALVKAGVIKDF